MSRILQRRALERDINEARRELGAVDLTPHRPEDCPRMVQPDGSCDIDAPCYFVSCKHHLHGDVTEAGWLIVNRPALDLDQLPDHCAITVASRGSHGLDVIGYHLGCTARQASEICEAAEAKFREGMLAAVADAERAEPGCSASLALDRRRPTRFDPRLDEDMDRTMPDGFVPISETMEVVVGAHREIVRTSGEHIMRRYQLPRLAERLYLLLISNAEWRRCGLAELTRAHADQTGNSTKADKIAAALGDLEAAGLVRLDWRACGKVRRLRGVSLVSSLRSAEKYPDGGNQVDCEDSDEDYLRASDERETVD